MATTSTPETPHATLLVAPKKRRQITKRKTVNVAFRLDEHVHARLLADSLSAGISTRAWLEQAVVGNATQIVAKKQKHPDLAKLLFLVARAGNNLNQVAHALNTAQLRKGIGPDDYGRAMVTLAEVERLLAEALSDAG